MHMAAEKGDGSHSQEEKASNESTPMATKAAQLAAEIVASPLFYLMAGRRQSLAPVLGYVPNGVISAHGTTTDWLGRYLHPATSQYTRWSLWLLLVGRPCRY